MDVEAKPPIIFFRVKQLKMLHFMSALYDIGVLLKTELLNAHSKKKYIKHLISCNGNKEFLTELWCTTFSAPNKRLLVNFVSLNYHGRFQYLGRSRNGNISESIIVYLTVPC